MGIEPRLQLRLFVSAEADATRAGVVGRFQCALGVVDLMRCKEALNVVALGDSAEASCCADKPLPGGCRELRVNLVPVVANEVPGLCAGMRMHQESNDQLVAILVAYLAGDGVVQRPLDQRGVLKVREQQ